MASHLSFQDRCVLATLLREGLKLRAIADKMDRSVSTVSDELSINGGAGPRRDYDPHAAQLQSALRKWKANSRNPLKSKRVYGYVVEKLQKEEWSPEEISHRMRKEFPCDREMRVSHETIYRFVNSPEGKELGLVTHLRKGKVRRSRRRFRLSGHDGKGIRNARSIRERPKIVNGRRRFGDWETDTMEGSHKSTAAVSVQKERRSGYVRLTKIRNKSAAETRRAIVRKLASFPRTLRRTLTFDRGKEGAQHQRISRELNLLTYFCDPYTSWQKGAVENVIGLVRQYLPKGMDLSATTPAQLKVIERKLNTRPRKSLGWNTPQEVLSSHLQTLGVRIRG